MDSMSPNYTQGYRDFLTGEQSPAMPGDPEYEQGWTDAEVVQQAGFAQAEIARTWPGPGFAQGSKW
jgi:hypothetical protein